MVVQREDQVLQVVEGEPQEEQLDQQRKYRHQQEHHLRQVVEHGLDEPVRVILQLARIPLHATLDVLQPLGTVLVGDTQNRREIVGIPGLVPGSGKPVSAHSGDHLAATHIGTVPCPVYYLHRAKRHKQKHQETDHEIQPQRRQIARATTGNELGTQKTRPEQQIRQRAPEA